MSLSCEIIFDNNANGKYSAGEILTGKIVLETDKVQKVKGKLVKKICDK